MPQHSSLGGGRAGGIGEATVRDEQRCEGGTQARCQGRVQARHARNGNGLLFQYYIYIIYMPLQYNTID